MNIKSLAHALAVRDGAKTYGTVGEVVAAVNIAWILQQAAAIKVELERGK